jgi:predicted phage tail protein
MITVNFHGFLKKKYGDSLKINLSRTNDLVIAIDSIKKGFRKTINDLNLKGQYYSCVADKKNKKIDLLPCISGSKNTFRRIFGAFLIVVGVALAFVGFPTLGINIAFLGLSILLAPKMPKLEQQKQAVGGLTSTPGSSSKSYYFLNNTNIATQGTFVPVGYGKYKVNSNLINFSQKNFSTSYSFNQIIQFDKNANIFLSEYD